MRRPLRKYFIPALVIALMGALLAVSPALAGSAQTPKAGPINQLSTQMQAVQGDQIPTLLQMVLTLQERVDALEGKMASKDIQINTLQNQVTALKNSPVQTLAPFISVVADPINGLNGPHIIFTGANVHIRSGSGLTNDQFNLDTYATLTSLGNLVIGYNEKNGGTTGDVVCRRSGAHNLIIGEKHQYAGYGNLVAGEANTIFGQCLSVTGGSGNSARDSYGSISGGKNNLVVGWYGWIGGGESNRVDYHPVYANMPMFSSICGGMSNSTYGLRESILGGNNQNIMGEFQTIPPIP
jgi:hypothetical protein